MQLGLFPSIHFILRMSAVMADSFLILSRYSQPGVSTMQTYASDRLLNGPDKVRFGKFIFQNHHIGKNNPALLCV
jgi:hypothetical protein